MLGEEIYRRTFCLYVLAGRCVHSGSGAAGASEGGCSVSRSSFIIVFMAITEYIERQVAKLLPLGLLPLSLKTLP